MSKQSGPKSHTENAATDQGLDLQPLVQQFWTHQEFVTQLPYYIVILSYRFEYNI